VHAVVIRYSVSDKAALPAELEKIMSEVSDAPGFVAGYWIDMGEDEGISVSLLDSEEEASMQALGSQVAERSAMTAGTPEVGEVIAHA
jgi:hypothetical protein